ncbi:methylthioribulose 1-phosphate dehydratase [Vampirovibrio chlorellavorus]|uniref:methylthioribulose 1-phosphate dehydratase n=1 Tax=Vampirovibrio chlorellavorus TaxID=758823 RepID=UPI0026EA451F|nr:methylthioribulose 1-phosphate dehydratase [Vampirovibrio chlorellavorus]
MSSSFSHLPPQAQRLESLTEVIHFLHARGWTPATSSNFSCRLPEGQAGFSVSVSGLDKGSFRAQDFLDVDFNGQIIRPEQAHCRPSAETLLHALVYQKFPDTQVVLHTHSVNGTVLSKLYEAEKGLLLKEFEVLKGLEGIATHQAELRLPIFSNHQDMTVLAAQIEPVLREQTPVYGFLLAGHGLYTWGNTLAQAKRHVEVFEFLFECILKLRSHGYPDYS